MVPGETLSVGAGGVGDVAAFGPDDDAVAFASGQATPDDLLRVSRMSAHSGVPAMGGWRMEMSLAIYDDENDMDWRGLTDVLVR